MRTDSVGNRESVWRGARAASTAERRSPRPSTEGRVVLRESVTLVLWFVPVRSTESEGEGGMLDIWREKERYKLGIEERGESKWTQFGTWRGLDRRQGQVRSVNVT